MPVAHDQPHVGSQVLVQHARGFARVLLSFPTAAGFHSRRQRRSFFAHQQHGAAAEAASGFGAGIAKRWKLS